MSSQIEEEKSNNVGFCQKLKLLSKNYDFIMVCLALTFLYFIVSGVMYWTPDYM